MSLVDTLWSAFASLRANILRTVLTTLGIIIGVAAVIAMVGVGSGAEQRIQGVIDTLGSNVLFVSNGSSISGGARGGSGSLVSLTEADARAIEEEAPSVVFAAPSVRASAQLIRGSGNWFSTIYGAGDGYLKAREWHIATGRTFSPQEERSPTKLAVIGQTVVDQLFPDEDPVGQMMRIKRVPFTIIGTLRAKGETPYGGDQDDVVFIPITTAKARIVGGDRYRGPHVANITVKAASARLIMEAEREVTEILQRRHRIQPGQPDDFRVRNVAQMLEARAQSERIMSILLASVAGISLLVGGIGIMNIMLVSVTERTREIGLRMAVGARSRDILLQFVTEAVAVSLIGGAIGIVIGLAGSIAAARIGDWPIVTSPVAALLAIGFAALVGIFFGYYPAYKASRLDPIIALRHE
jgi:putative ABC transport system permease protein